MARFLVDGGGQKFRFATIRFARTSSLQRAGSGDLDVLVLATKSEDCSAPTHFSTLPICSIAIALYASQAR